MFAISFGLRLFRKQKNHSASAIRMIAMTGPTTAPAINAMSTVLEARSGAGSGVAVGVVSDDSLEARGVTAGGVVPGDSLETEEVTDVGVLVVVVVVSSVVEVLDSVKTEVTVRISTQFWWLMWSTVPVEDITILRYIVDASHLFPQTISVTGVWSAAGYWSYMDIEPQYSLMPGQ
jgi:hypothetical protein